MAQITIRNHLVISVINYQLLCCHWLICFYLFFSFLGCLYVCNKYAHFRSSFINWQLRGKSFAQWSLADLWKSCGKIKYNFRQSLLKYYTRDSYFIVYLLFVFLFSPCGTGMGGKIHSWELFQNFERWAYRNGEYSPKAYNNSSIFQRF